MLPAINTSSATGTAFPDVCVTPPGEPTPYTNVATCAEAEDTAEGVLICSLPAVHIGSVVPSTEGDEAGTMSPNTGEGSFLVGAAGILVEGCPAVNLTTPTLQNDDIAPGAVLVPSVTNVLLNLAGAGDLRALRDELAAASVRVCEMEAASLVAIDLLTRSTAMAARGHVARLPIDRPVVLDLRGCRGGDLHAALALAGAFLPAGTPLVRVLEPDGEETLHVARTSRPLPHALVVLVDARTASAAEALAAALQVSDRAVLVGARTFGKGGVEVAVAGGRAARGTCVTPDGRAIEGRGVTPDVVVDGDAMPEALAVARCMAIPSSG